MEQINAYRFSLNDAEVIHINGIPYRHVGNGVCEGGTDPEFARRHLPANTVGQPSEK